MQKYNAGEIDYTNTILDDAYELLEKAENTKSKTQAIKYAKEAYDAEKWAFVSDYVRLKVMYEQGGIYLDTDVELIKPLDDLIKDGGYMGFDDNSIISTGLGFACEKGNELIGALLADYDDISFLNPDGTYDLTPCPDRNSKTMARLGMNLNNKDQIFMGIHMLPEDYLCPIKYYTGKKVITNNTYSIHHFDASWFEKSWKEGQKKRWRREKLRYIVHIPNRILMKILGDKNYAKLKSLLKKG